MKRIFLTVVRLSIVPLLLGLGAMTGGIDGFVGWFMLAWMLFRGGPGMWRDTRNAVRWFLGLKLRIPGRRTAAGDLNV